MLYPSELRGRRETSSRLADIRSAGNGRDRYAIAEASQAAGENQTREWRTARCYLLVALDESAICRASVYQKQCVGKLILDSVHPQMASSVAKNN